MATTDSLYSTPVVDPNAPTNTTSGGLAPMQFSYSNNTSTGGGSSGSTANSASNSALEQWYLQSGRNSADYFNRTLQSGLPTGGYQGQRVAGLDPYQQAGIGQASGYLDSSAPMYGQGAGALSQAGGYLSDSAQWSDQAMMQHMNPYLDGALGAVEDRANRNLMENVMPGVNSTFTGAGQFGSTRNADFLNRAIRDNQMGISETQAGMVNTAYDNAARDYLGWAQQGSQAGTQLGALGNTMGQYGITGLNTGMNLGGLNQQQQQQQFDAAQKAWLENYTVPLDTYNSLAGGYNNSVGRLAPTSTSSSVSNSNSTQYNNSNGSSYSF